VRAPARGRGIGPAVPIELSGPVARLDGEARQSQGRPDG
jgi:hypothetical protein